MIATEKLMKVIPGEGASLQSQAGTGCLRHRHHSVREWCHSVLPVVQPNTLPETCDNQDEDCDGNVDEDLGAPIGNDCRTACGEGRVVCILGRQFCDGPQTGRNELCNGLDDDCDGIADESRVDEPLPGVGGACRTGSWCVLPR